MYRRQRKNIKMSSDNLQELYSQIPEFDCVPGCTDCCGPWGCSKQEWETIIARDKREGKGLDCPYICEKGCSIHDIRPLVCRMFGVVEAMQCPHGQGPETLLTVEKELEIKDAYQEFMIG